MPKKSAKKTAKKAVAKKVVKKTTGRGGTRKGAGRPKVSTVSRPRPFGCRSMAFIETEVAAEKKAKK